MEFNDLLVQHSIDPSTCLVLRHRPREPELRRKLPWLAAEQPAVFNIYQQTQSSKAERQMVRAKTVSAFIGHEPGCAVFVGLYEMRGYRELSRAAIDKLPAQQMLYAYGGFYGDPRSRQLFFDLVLLNTLSNWQGKLIVRWPPPEIAWSRWAKGNRFAIEAILQESMFAESMPDWRDIVLTWGDLKAIPTRWRRALEQWRGIYFIWDAKVKKGYVGAAYGTENLYQRWTNYAKTGHGGNKLLRLSDPNDLQFSILERLSPDMPDAEVIDRERTWKTRLHSREFGLNAN